MPTIPYSGHGMASVQSDSFNSIELFFGKAPTVSTAETLIDQGADLAAYAVVGRITASGKITLCNPAAVDGSQKPIGITVCPVVRNGVLDQGVAVWRDGGFNMLALAWHAGFNTDALKLRAFEGSASPTAIFIGKQAI